MPASTWLIAGLALIALELLLPAMLLVWFGLGGLLVGALLLALPDLSTLVQLLVWLAASLAFTALWFAAFRPGKKKLTAGQSATILGEIGLLTTACGPYRDGQVRFQKPLIGAESWTARAESDLAAGTRVHVVRVDGQVLLVATK